MEMKLRRGDRVTVVHEGGRVRETITSSEGNQLRFESGATMDRASMTYTPKTGAALQVDRIER